MSEGALSSPNPTANSRFTKCLWLITVPEFNIISIQFTRLDHCKEGSVLIYDGETEQSPLLGVKCNKPRLLDRKIVSSGNKVLVRFSFKNLSQDSAPHFEAKYVAMTPGKMV